MDEKHETEGMLTSDAARDFLGVSRTTMHRLVQNGELRGLKVGGQWRFARADLVAHLERKPVGIAAKSLPELDSELDWWKEAAGTEVEAYSPEEKIAALGNAILVLALERGSSDAHFEPGTDTGRVKFRADGVLETVREMTMGVFVPLLNRLKESGALSLEETRIPQDGRILLEHKEQRFDLRMTTCPTTRGESLMVRVLFRGEPPSLESLGLGDEQLNHIKALVSLPQGLVLLCGPTGSGKGTLFYALLDFLLNDTVKVVSIEDPVEADLSGVLQTNVQTRIGLTFAATLRAFLRVDPDIIGVSDLPDLETTEVAVQAALSGHMVLAQLNVSDVATALLRLRDMGLEPFLLGTAVEGIIAQRLVRRVCSNCTRDAEIAPAVAARIEQIAGREEFVIPVSVKWKCGSGCARCRQSGYRGRLALFEIVTMNESLKQAVVENAGVEDIAHLVRASGAKTLWQIGLEHAVRGETTPDELMRVLSL